MVKQDGDTEIFSSMQAGPEHMPDYVDVGSTAKRSKKKQVNRWMPIIWIAIVIVAFLIGLGIGLVL
ncbi:MAG: hypothetical protein V3W28_08630 [Thermoplasmata archaeon]